MWFENKLQVNIITDNNEEITRFPNESDFSLVHHHHQKQAVEVSKLVWIDLIKSVLASAKLFSLLTIDALSWQGNSISILDVIMSYMMNRFFCFCESRNENQKCADLSLESSLSEVSETSLVVSEWCLWSSVLLTKVLSLEVLRRESSSSWNSVSWGWSLGCLISRLLRLLRGSRVGWSRSLRSRLAVSISQV